MRLLLVIMLLLSASCGPRAVPLETPLAPGGSYVLETPRQDLGQRRSFLLHVPAIWDGHSPLPVLVALHGAFMTGSEMEQRSGLSRLADEKGFAVLYPEGLGVMGYLQHWNAGFCCGKAAKDNIDDLGFIDVCLSEALKRLPLDKKRIYLAGLSNGGMLALHYALNGRHKLAGVLAVAAAMPEKPQAFPKGRETPVMLVHGLEDTHIPYIGGGFKNREDGPRFLGQEDAAAYWAAANGCSQPQRRQDARGKLDVLEWRHCATDKPVMLLGLHGFGHDWPHGQASANLRDVQGRVFDAGRLFWESMGE